MLFTGVLKKMKTELQPDSVQYFLDFPNDVVFVNQLLNRKISFKFEGYQCLNCGKDKVIFRQGFCRSCFYETPEAGEWIMKPELSTAHLDKEDRDLEYEKAVQLQPHIVYLANSSHVKVGVTRKTQIPTRWIDQGAHEAIPILEAPNRYLAGITEVALKEHISDKTNWRDMLRNKSEKANLEEIRNSLQQYIPEETGEYFLNNASITHIHFPVLQSPDKIKSLNIEKALNYSGVLKGIKGQYFIFEDNTVWNIRANSGLVVSMGLEV